jgi:hypothetical protein
MCNPSYMEAKVGGFQVQGCPGQKYKSIWKINFQKDVGAKCKALSLNLSTVWIFKN